MKDLLFEYPLLGIAILTWALFFGLTLLVEHKNYNRYLRKGYVFHGFYDFLTAWRPSNFHVIMQIHFFILHVVIVFLIADLIITFLT